MLSSTTNVHPSPSAAFCLNRPSYQHTTPCALKYSSAPGSRLHLASIHPYSSNADKFTMPLLNRLSTEMLLHIFASANSRIDLLALAGTSQRLYSIFQSDRVALIYHAFANELGPHVLADALALSHIKAIPRKLKDRQAYIHQFGGVVSTYGQQLAGYYHVSPRTFSMDYVLQLICTYRTVVLVTDAYIAGTLRLLQRDIWPYYPGTDPEKRLTAPPSRAEWLRVLRAHYRLHIVLSFWFSRAHRGWTKSPEIQRLSCSLFGLWEPWEVQQVFCAGAFYMRIHSLLSAVYFGDQHFQRRSILGRCFGYMSDLFDEFRYLVVRVRAVNEKAWQETLDKASTFQPGSAILPVLEAAGADEEEGLRWFQARLCEDAEPDLPRRPSFPVSLRFVGERVNAVPFGWVDAFGGHYGYNFLRVQPGMRSEGQLTRGLWSRAGFVMWDKPRVEAMKASSCLSPAATDWARSPTSSR
ncbi:hypothetical protein CONLIGDRAFT_481742 [Coniochaeta ligniaria NRRL 30616]|uniref:F-box domain-containing protein n=1 Tax=Coniochaeta ligniaria NRRL 30616 TaxID=1408157 RepID=A0A1J7JG78_9PEZI|nr:hypothetical protein CONLIGDRAFT_481742 [Coniochaeta ligniaria NRRL 30616]